MKNARVAAVLGLLIAVALAVGLASREAAPDSPMPSITNPGPLGLKALFVYLREGGRDVSAQEASLESLPAETRTLIIAAPQAQPVTKEEVSALDRFVQGGGTLVYLSPHALGKHQPGLEEWLGLVSGALPGTNHEGLDSEWVDPAGVTVDVWLPAGALRGLSWLRVSRDRSLRMEREDAVPLAGRAGASVVWRWAHGKGEVYVVAGADLAENRRLELLDNLRFWDALAARGPLRFDEFHHATVTRPPLSHGLWVFIAQALAVGLVYVVSRGTRFGAPRPVRVERHRSSREYVRSLGWLMRRAKVEAELLPELDSALRRLMQERLGIAPSLPDAEAARLLEETCGVPAREYLDAKEDLVRTRGRTPVKPSDYTRLARRYANLERRVTGRAGDAPR
ncbi:DUF4350 domain-containing protein [Corallococcus praedator]|uniref:DUF4350 domain-containing protein n=1 Tax=Corallococcus praedator TaxID=2316724 RepID=A0ABX9QK16_9BACT|nr:MULTISPECIES: DUF4350 domain-containing protein [Corallococcus]RKH35125.1 DUF4350 domain-containing protein [Corallococcus sp. CA031C]RKI10886.1 DUF4350 domain-containing protein [Corallococcus praedator]